MNKIIPAKYYIGLSSNYHDPSVALVNDEGRLVFAEATERSLQSKRALSAAADNLFFIEKILKKYPITDYEIALNWTQLENPLKYPIIAGLVSVARKYPRFAKWILKNIVEEPSGYFYSLINHFSAVTMAGSSFRLTLNMQLGVPTKPFTGFDHHLCHAYYAYFTSPCAKATILVLDGAGDNGSSYSVYKANKQNIQQVFRTKSCISLGEYYGNLTYLCGFSQLKGEEWKVMGMAPYGKMHVDLLTDLKECLYISGIYLKIKKPRQFSLIRKKIKENLYEGLTRYDIAYTGHFYYETLVTELIKNIHAKWPEKNLIIVGGCGLNSAYNGRIHLDTPFKNVYIPSAPADDGCSAGAAFLSFRKHNPKKEIPYHQVNPYLGFEIKEEDILHLVKYSGYSVEKMEYTNLYPRIAKELQEGKTVAWVQGRAEFGPRALGNRSILANPMLAEMKDKINSTIKYREEFRPFAPAILEEKAEAYFENYHPTPYMERVLKIKENKRTVLPAVTHVDGTGRLQTVTRQANEHFYNLITAFYKLTDVPVLLNTSFNVMEKPIVNSVSDMAAVFATSGLDILVIHQYVFKKHG